MPYEIDVLTAEEAADLLIEDLPVTKEPMAIDALTPEAAATLLSQFRVNSQEELEILRRLYEENETSMVRNMLRLACDHRPEFAESRIAASEALRLVGFK